jgi:Family of unknown function (DUF6011)
MIMLAQAIRHFIAAGNATFTIQSIPTGRHYTYRVRRGNGRAAPLFASVLVAPDTYAYLGIVYLTSGKLVATDASKVRLGAPSFDALAWFLRVLARTPADGAPRDVIFRHEGRCGRCARELTHPESIDSGIGPECAAKLGLAREPTRGPSGAAVQHLPPNPAKAEAEARGISLQQILAERRAAIAGEADRNGDFTDLGTAS